MNPSRGFKLIFSTSVGDKTTTTDANNFNEDNASSTQYRINASLGSYYTVNSGSIIYAGFNTGLLQNSQGLFLNDLFRTGGLQSIRGFNENEFFASKYLVTNFEYRFLLEEASYFFMFFDQSYLGYDIANVSFRDHPSGIGAGFKLKTNGGIFNLVYGIGRRNGQRFSFNLSKIQK